MPISVLEEICKKKAAHVQRCKSSTPLELLKEKIQNTPEPVGFIKSLLSRNEPALITEIKKASPSKGIIREDFDPIKIAKIYKDGGATCISVLTDEPYFQGCDQYLVDVKSHCPLPVLRKDFMIEPYQIFESRALGADCILLIMAALNDTMAADLYELATDLGMDVLVEIHDEAELDRALKLKPAMIGVNNRNLKTLDVDINTSKNLITKIPDDVLKVAESGISDKQTIEQLYSLGYTAFLIGESLMREDDIASALIKIKPNI